MAERRGRPAAMSSRDRWLMVTVILGSGIVFLDTSVVSLALKRIGQEVPSSLFGVLEGQSYVFSGYLVTLSALLILAGAMNDYFGRRRMFGIGLIGFGVTSVMCGLAPTLELLVVFRVLQGAAGAILVPGSLSIITANFRGEEQGRAFGIWAGASAATTILGPFVGGVLVNSVSWRAVFFINVPLVLVAQYALRHVPESRDEEASSRFDWLGAILVVVAVGGLAFGAIRGQETGFRTAVPFISLALGTAATVLVPIRMVRAGNPLVPLHLFRSRNFTVTNISTFVIYGALYVALAFLPVFLTGTLGYNEQGAGLATIPGSFLLALFSARFGRLAARFGPRVFMAMGPAIMAVGVLWFVRLPPDSTPWILGTGPDPATGLPRSIVPPGDYLVDVLPGLLVFGAGLMIMVAPLTTALMTSVPARHSGVASAINNAISRIGSPLVTAIIFIALTASFYGLIEERVPSADVGSPSFRRLVAPLNPPDPRVSQEVRAVAREASTEAFHLAMVVAVVLLLAGAVVNAVGIRNPRAGGDTAPESEPSRARGGAREDPGRGDRSTASVPPRALPVDRRMGREKR